MPFRCCPGVAPAGTAASEAMTAQRITKRTVAALPSTGSEFTAWDDAVSGFGVRVRPTGSEVLCSRL
jgi:hypothetical protein